MVDMGKKGVIVRISRLLRVRSSGGIRNFISLMKRMKGRVFRRTLTHPHPIHHLKQSTFLRNNSHLSTLLHRINPLPTHLTNAPHPSRPLYNHATTPLLTPNPRLTSPPKTLRQNEIILDELPSLLSVPLLLRSYLGSKTLRLDY